MMRNRLSSFALFVASFLIEPHHVLSSSSTRKLPHIIFVVIDDLGSGDLGRSGSNIETPTLDELSRDGVYFENYYVLPYCSPTRATFMTGRYPLHTGCHTIIADYHTQGLPLDEETLPQVLRKAGYRAHAVGKWHLGHSRTAQTPTFRGFESYFGFLHGHSDYYTHVKQSDVTDAYEMRQDIREFCGKNCTRMADERGNYSTHVFTREAIKIIDSHQSTDGPLFLYLAHQAVHYPDEVPSEYLSKYKDYKNWTGKRKMYAAMLTAVDESVKNVTLALKDKGMWNDTIIIATTDNGGPTAVCMVQGSSNGYRRGGKCTVWEGGTTGDAFLSGPAVESLYDMESEVYTDLFHAVDWLPTLATMTGSTPEGKPLDGVSHQERLQGKSQSSPPREELFVGYAQFNNMWYGPAVRWRSWKLLQGKSGGPESRTHFPKGSPAPASGGIWNATYSLFNLDSDPEERHDVSRDYPMIVDIMRKKLALYQESYVPPIQPTDPSCPYNGIENTTEFGPTYIPWCDGALEIVYST